MIAHRRGRVIIIDETARRPIRLVPRETRTAKPILLSVFVSAGL